MPSGDLHIPTEGLDMPTEGCSEVADQEGINWLFRGHLCMMGMKDESTSNRRYGSSHLS